MGSMPTWAEIDAAVGQLDGFQHGFGVGGDPLVGVVDIGGGHEAAQGDAPQGELHPVALVFDQHGPKANLEAADADPRQDRQCGENAHVLAGAVNTCQFRCLFRRLPEVVSGPIPRCLLLTVPIAVLSAPEVLRLQTPVRGGGGLERRAKRQLEQFCCRSAIWPVPIGATDQATGLDF